MATYEVNDDISPNRTVVYISSKFEGKEGWNGGSGTIVGNNDILTASHVVYDERYGGWATETKIYTSYDAYLSDPSSYYSYAFGSAYNWDENGDGLQNIGNNNPNTLGESEKDIALLSLTTDIGSIYGSMGYKFDFSSGTASKLGYPEKYDNSLMYDEGLIFKDSIDNYFIFEDNEIEINSGDSGGPIYINSGGNTGYEVIGVISGKNEVTGEGVATALNAHKTWLLDKIESNNYLYDNSFATLTSANSVDEGSSISFTFKTHKSEENKQYRYTLSGVSSSDFSSNALSGTTTIDENGEANFTIGISADQKTEGTENFTVSIGEKTKSISINDTSTDEIKPLITGPSGNAGAATSKKTINENTTTVHTFTANETVTWLLNGGADASKFSINSSTGALTFSSAPDYESPTDSDSGNNYVVVVRATDSASNTSDQTLTVSVADVDELSPSITGPSGSAGDSTSSKSINENTTAVHTFTANESVTWSLDQSTTSLFTIDGESGALSFKQTPDYETPFIPKGTVIKIETNLDSSSNDLYIELFDQEGTSKTLTTTTANNFLSYTNDSSYQNTIIHRSVSNFVIQGGGFTAPINAFSSPTALTSKGSIINEPGNSNKIGTIAMAKVSGNPDSATSQWFFNLVDNEFLDQQNEGFSVFGRVLADGFNVIEELANATIYNASNAYSNSVFSSLPLLNYDSKIGIQPDNFLIFKTINTIDNYSSIAPNTYNANVIATDSQGNQSSQYVIVSVNDLTELIATEENDSIQSTSSNDSIDGLKGTDTVTFTGNFSNYSFTRGTDTLQIADQRTTGTNDGTDTLKNIEYIQFADQAVEESKVDVVKTYSGNFSDYKFYNKGNGKYEIKTDSGYDDITGYPLLRFFGEASTSSFRDVSAIVDIKGTFDQVTGLNTDSGRMFRLYNASFKRLPDVDGLKYWIDNFSSGKNTIRVVASSFLGSGEFKQRYGEDVSDSSYVNTLYKNVLGRDADTGGLNYWLGQLNSGAETRYEVLLGFAESAENKTLFTEMTGFA